MAKWGEGDPRWIVEERPDATNVNNWHWTEKNATPWSKDRLEALFTNLKIERDGIECIIDKVTKCEGEATANNRKGKLIIFYEWQLKMTWTGRLLNHSQTQHKGTVSIPNLSEENNLDEIEITISIDKSNDESEMLKQFMYNVGRDVLREHLGVYVKDLKGEYSKNLILPKKDDEKVQQQQVQGTSNNVNSNIRNAFKANEMIKTATANNNSNSLGSKLDFKTLTMTVKFQCSASDLYNALTNADMLTAFTRGPVKVDATKGGEFILYDGNVHGKYEELIPGKRITQLWRLKTWASGHFSNVEINLEETKTNTILEITQTNIPASEYDATMNWHRYYWSSIKMNFGASLSVHL